MGIVQISTTISVGQKAFAVFTRLERLSGLSEAAGPCGHLAFETDYVGMCRVHYKHVPALSLGFGGYSSFQT